jgi:hypothetical protein
VHNGRGADTQQMTRYVLLQYRDDLLALQQEELAHQTHMEGNIARSSSVSRRLGDMRGMSSDGEKEQVASDLLVILQKIPIQVMGESAGGPAG